MRLCFSAGHGLESRKKGALDPGACANGQKEWERVHTMASRVSRDFAVLGYPTLFRDVGLYSEADDAAKAFGADIFIELHLDAAGSTAKGTTAFVGTHATARERRLASLLSSDVAAAVPTNNRGVKVSSDFAVLKGSVDTVLLEICYLTNMSDIYNFTKNHDKIELAIVNAILKGIGKKPVKSLPRTWPRAIANIRRFFTKR